jgi:hypothetical protein
VFSPRPTALLAADWHRLSGVALGRESLEAGRGSLGWIGVVPMYIFRRHLRWITDRQGKAWQRQGIARQGKAWQGRKGAAKTAWIAR